MQSCAVNSTPLSYILLTPAGALFFMVVWLVHNTTLSQFKKYLFNILIVISKYDSIIQSLLLS